MAIPFSFLVSWAKSHVSEDSSLKYVFTLEQKQSFQTVEEILSNTDSGKKISDLRACLASRIHDIGAAYQSSTQPTVLGKNPESDAFVDRLKAFIRGFLEIKLKSAPPVSQVVFRESFVPQPFHTGLPDDEKLASQFGVTGQTIRNKRKQYVDECRDLLLDGKIVDSYSADPSLVSDVKAFKDSFGGGISYETARRLTGISDDRTFYFLLRLFDLTSVTRDDVKIPAVLPNKQVNPYSVKIGRVIEFFRKETICIRFEEDVVPALKKITKDEGLFEIFKSVILRSDEFVHYQVQGQDYIALRWDLLHFLPQRVCWIVFQEKAFDLKSAVSSDRIVTLYNSREYAGKYKESRIDRDQIRAAQLNACWRLMNIGHQEYWMIRDSRNDEFNLGAFIRGIYKPGMTYKQFIQAAIDTGLIPIYSELTIAPYYEQLSSSTVRTGGRGATIDWDTYMAQAESLLKAQNKPMKSTDLARDLYDNNQLTSPFRAFATSCLAHLKSSPKFITENCASPRDGVWVALPGMTFPKSYRDEIRERAVDYLLKSPNYTMKRSDLYARVESMVPSDRNKAAALQSIFDDIDTFIKNGSGRNTTITLNPLLIP